jgi:hypothetical protein
MKSLHLTCLRKGEEEDDGRNSEAPKTFLPALGDTDTMRKYPMKVISMITPWLPSAVLRRMCTEFSRK